MLLNIFLESPDTFHLVSNIENSTKTFVSPLRFVIEKNKEKKVIAIAKLFALHANAKIMAVAKLFALHACISCIFSTTQKVINVTKSQQKTKNLI